MSRKEMEVSNLVACSTHRRKGTQKLTLKAASGGLLTLLLLPLMYI